MNTKLLFLVIMFCFCSKAMTQELSLLFGTGYTEFNSPSNYVRPVSEGGYGFQTSIPIYGGFKYITQNERSAIIAIFSYHPLSGHGSSPYRIEAVSALKPGETQVESAVWSGSLGARFPLFRSVKGPHVGGDFLLASFQEITTRSGSWEGDKSFARNGTLRYGVSVGAGLGIPFYLGTLFDLDVKYTVFSRFHGSSVEKTVKLFQLTLLLSIPIASST